MTDDPSPDSPILESLERQVALLAEAIRPADVFRRLLDATRMFVPRSAILLSREGCWKGWGASGYGRESAERLRQIRIEAGSGPLDLIAAAGPDEGVALLPADALPDFGQPEALETRAAPLLAGTRAVGLLVAQRGHDEEPWFPAALGVLATAARLRLELDLTLRKLHAAAKSAAPEAPAAAETVVAPAPLPAAAPAAAAETSIAPWLDPSKAPPQNVRRDEARRFARLVATDIRLYNEEAVVLGRRNRDLFRRLEEQIDRGREAFERRFPDLGAPGLSVLHDALVEILAGGDADLLPLPATDDPPPGAGPRL
jgi:hypothetical protein